MERRMMRLRVLTGASLLIFFCAGTATAACDALAQIAKATNAGNEALAKQMRHAEARLHGRRQGDD